MTRQGSNKKQRIETNKKFGSERTKSGSRRTNEFGLIEIGENWIDSLDRIDDANGPSKNDRIEANKKNGPNLRKNLDRNHDKKRSRKLVRSKP